MLVLVIVLTLTNLLALGALAWLLLRPVEHPGPDEVLARSLSRHRRPAVSTSSTRRVITIEILNAIELAGTRGRLAGIAGSLVPGITHRLVYDQAMKLVRRQLAEQQVVADVRLHVVATEFRPGGSAGGALDSGGSARGGGSGVGGGSARGGGSGVAGEARDSVYGESPDDGTPDGGSGGGPGGGSGRRLGNGSAPDAGPAGSAGSAP